MLVALLSSQYARFAALAEAWLAQGAVTFGIFHDEQLLAYWPPGHQLLTPDIIVPIMQGDAKVGELHVAGVTIPAAVDRLKADAALIGYILQLEDELQSMTADLVTSQDQQLALYRLAQMMRDHATVAETLQAIVGEAMRMVKAQASFAFFIPSTEGYQEPMLVQYPEHSLDDDLAWQVYWQALVTEKEVWLPEHASAVSLPAGVTNMIAVPIRVRGCVMAGLGLLNRQDGFGTHEIKLTRAIANQASTQIERVLLYQKTLDQTKWRAEMELARHVQTDLLPRTLPIVPGLDIYATSRPASQVGGDFFDFIVSQGRPFIFSLGDVTGKGLSAALLMTMTRTAIHSKAQFMPYPSPEAVMRQSNEDLYNDFTRIGVFATAFVGQYDPESRQLLYANAGHAPVIYRHREGEPTLLRADSTAIGILPTSYCRNQILTLNPGDLLIAATDGFSDARNSHDETFEIERLMLLIDRLADRPASMIAEAIFETVDRFGGGQPQDDDQTLVVIKGSA